MLRAITSGVDARFCQRVVEQVDENGQRFLHVRVERVIVVYRIANGENSAL